MRSIILSALLFTMVACGSKNSSSPSQAVATKATPEAAVQQAPMESKFNLPPLPVSEFQRLFSEVTYVDYIFYNLPFALSQDNQPGIQGNLKMISSGPLDNLPIECEPIGREFFHIGGEIAYEADLYFSMGCFGYVFLKDEKPVYGAKLTQEGMNFYKNIIAQSTKMTKSPSNG